MLAPMAQPRNTFQGIPPHSCRHAIIVGKGGLDAKGELSRSPSLSLTHSAGLSEVTGRQREAPHAATPTACTCQYSTQGRPSMLEHSLLGNHGNKYLYLHDSPFHIVLSVFGAMPESREGDLPRDKTDKTGQG